MQKKLVEMIIEIIKVQLLVWCLGILVNVGKVFFVQILMVKCNNVYMVLEIVCEVCQIYGGMGIINEYFIMCYMMNLEIVLIYEGIYDIYLLIMGMDVMGLNVFKQIVRSQKIDVRLEKLEDRCQIIVFDF